MRVHKLAAAGIVFLFFAAPGFGQDKRRARPFSWQSAPQTTVVWNCGDFEIWEDWVDFAHGVLIYDKDGQMVRQLLNTSFGRTNIYYNASSPELFLSGSPGEGQNFRWEYQDGFLYMSGVFNKIMIPGYGHILMETGRLAINLETGEATNTGVTPTSRDWEAVCGFLRPKP